MKMLAFLALSLITMAAVSAEFAVQIGNNGIAAGSGNNPYRYAGDHRLTIDWGGGADGSYQISCVSRDILGRPYNNGFCDTPYLRYQAAQAAAAREQSYRSSTGYSNYYTDDDYEDDSRYDSRYYSNKRDSSYYDRDSRNRYSYRDTYIRDDRYPGGYYSYKYDVSKYDSRYPREQYDSRYPRW